MSFANTVFRGCRERSNYRASRALNPSTGANGNAEGRASAARFPCHTGKTREKIFLVLPHEKKSRLIISLGATAGQNRRLGREPAGKASTGRYGLESQTYCCPNVNYSIDIL